MRETAPECEICGEPMHKIIVDVEDDGSLLTAYECPEHQTIADLKTESVEVLQQEGSR